MGAEESQNKSMEAILGPSETAKILAEKQGVPVTVDPVIMKNEVGDVVLGGSHEVGGDEITYSKKNSFAQQKTLPDEPSQGWDFDGGLKGVKSINGLNEDADKINGHMNGDEEVHGGASVGGNKVTFS